MFSLLPWYKEREGGRVAPWAERPMSLVRSDLDELFDRFFSRWAPLFEGGVSEYGLAVEEKDDTVLVRADAPGFEPADFDIQVSEDTMTIVAERKKMAKEGETPTIERRLERRFTLPARVDPGKVEAIYRNGVLEVRLVRAEPVKYRKVAVKG